MDRIVFLFSNYGHAVVFLGVFLETVGLPVPAEVVLFAAGAIGHGHAAGIVSIILVGTIAAVLGDSTMFFVGRKINQDRERRVIKLYCRWTYCTLESDHCHQRARRYIDRFDARTLFFTKFLLGARQFIAPLAGMARIRPSSFLILDAIGSLIWASAIILLGVFFFRDYLAAFVGRFEQIRTITAAVLVLGLVGFFLRKAYGLRRYGTPKVE